VYIYPVCAAAAMLAVDFTTAYPGFSVDEALFLPYKFLPQPDMAVIKSP